MVDKLLIDTWGWLTLRDKRESRHKEVANFFNNFYFQSNFVYTTDYVLDETFTLLFKRLSSSQAKESMELLLNSVKEGLINLEFITPERFMKTKVMRFKYEDKPNISFTDLSSMVVMKELKVTHILTDDSHFTHVGLGFNIVP
jgi:predicted nucleic acid-binding protein